MIPLSAQTIETFTPPSLKERKPLVEFHIGIPTLEDRDKVNVRLFAAGVIPITSQDMRNRIIHEIFLSHPDDEEEAERKAQLIEEGSAAQELHSLMVTQWQERERERMADILEGVPDLPAEPMPIIDMPLRRRTEFQMLWTDTIHNSPRLREMSAMVSEYAAEQRRMIARFHLLGWDGLKAQREAVSMPKQGEIVTLESLFAVRAEIGEIAWVELLDKTQSLYDVDRRAVGNFGSPPVNSLPQSGSEDRSGESVKVGGASTKPTKPKTTRSNITPIPDGASPATIAPSLPSSGASGGRKGLRRGRTVAAS